MVFSSRGSLGGTEGSRGGTEEGMERTKGSVGEPGNHLISQPAADSFPSRGSHEAEAPGAVCGYALTFGEAALELLTPEAVRAVVAGLIGKASGGDVRAYESLRELTGEALPDMEELRVTMRVVE